jgi:DNA polymerase-3 subunit alpha
MSFAQLHVHSQYSFLDGAIKVKELPDAAKAAGMTAVAITDRGNMFGAIEFQTACVKAGVKPIFGCEVNVVAKDRSDPSDRRYTNMVLLAEDIEGYRNLIACVSHSWLDGWQNDIPRVDRALLAEYKTGIIAMSGGLAGDVSQALLRRDRDAASLLAAGWRDLFGPENFFLQVEEIGFKENAQINEQLVEIAQEYRPGQRLQRSRARDSERHVAQARVSDAGAILVGARVRRSGCANRRALQR